MEFCLLPPEIALAMLDQVIEEAMLEEFGVVCERCGEKHFPDEMHGTLCDQCVMDTLMESIVALEQAELMRIEAEAALVKVVELLTDEYVIDLRQF